MKSSFVKRALLALAGTTLLTTTMPAFTQDKYIGEIFLFSGNFQIRDTAFANGDEIPISQFTNLFSIIGVTYGGDGRSTFGLPDLRGRSAIGTGQGTGLSNYVLGQEGGTETASLGVSNMPSHSHNVTIHATGTEGDSDQPTGNAWAVVDRTDLYSTSAPDVTMAAGTATVENSGNGVPFSIRDPYLALHYLIVLEGLFPPRN